MRIHHVAVSPVHQYKRERTKITRAHSTRRRFRFLSIAATASSASRLAETPRSSVNVPPSRNASTVSVASASAAASP